MYDYKVLWLQEDGPRLESTCLCATWSGPAGGQPCAYPCRPLQTKLTHYGISAEDYFAMLRRQRGLCPLCFVDLRSLPPRLVVIDHDHQTGRVRGVVCQSCNMRLRYLDGTGTWSDLDSLDRARKYVAEAKALGPTGLPARRRRRTNRFF